MPLIETKGAASAQGFGEFAASSGPVTYIEDVFSTYLYTGTNTTNPIVNSIGLSTKGGMVWIKNRASGYNNLTDTARGVSAQISSNSTSASGNYSAFQSFNTNGFTVYSGDLYVNASGNNYASWTFRKQPKFFDVVTYTGNGGTQNISHSLGSTPGCIIIKCTSSTGNWPTYHRSTSSGYYLYLNGTGAQSNASAATFFGNNTTTVAPTSTQFTIGSSTQLNTNGETFVAYLFAHNAGGFGLTGTDNVISCGSFTTASGSGIVDVTLGYEPQWVLFKTTGTADDWVIMDNMRGFPIAGSANALRPNASNAESGFGTGNYPTATGFHLELASGSTYIYIAIRRGPMKVPTSGTGVFQPVTRTGTGTDATVTNSSISYVDFLFSKARTNTAAAAEIDRLRGNAKLLYPRYTDAETTIGTGYPKLDVMNGYTTDGVQNFNQGSTDFINYFFKRAPSFFDVVCYTGDGTGSFNVNHNLGITPEMAIIKRRNAAAAWPVFFTNTYSYLNQAFGLGVSAGGLSGRSTSTTINVGTLASLASTPETNASGGTYVVYIFATCVGVSKVGSYTGTGSLQTINCGFTTGARFVMIKRTDSSADWYYWDSARGITSGSDPYLIMNSDAAEVNATNYVDTDSTGFKVTAAAPSDLNASGGTYLFLAIA